MESRGRAWEGRLSQNAICPNLPPYHAPRHLKTFLQAAQDDIFLAPLNIAHPNLPEEQLEGLEEVVAAQRRGDYKGLPDDKGGGGVTIVDLPDYKMVAKEQLTATYLAVLPNLTTAPPAPSTFKTYWPRPRSWCRRGSRKGSSTLTMLRP